MEKDLIFNFCIYVVETHWLDLWIFFLQICESNNKINFLISLLFLHSCSRNSLAGLVVFFPVLKKNIIFFFLYSYCFYIEKSQGWTGTEFSCIVWVTFRSHFVGKQCLGIPYELAFLMSIS